MTIFLDLRLHPVGGELSSRVAICQGTSISDYAGLLQDDLLEAVRGRNLLIATHGFNVNRTDGIATLSNWDKLLHLGPGAAFLGLLWPGDSIWAHGLDYPDEPKVADEAGALLAAFIEVNLQESASISFASHSLGARVVLSTIKNLHQRVRRLTLMAGAIDDNCLNAEFQLAAAKVGEISVLASKEDKVLSRLFPLGNFFGGLLDQGHPWWHAAIGHCGPQRSWPANFAAPFLIPGDWEFQHGDYLHIDANPPALNPPVIVPPQGAPKPAGGAAGWQEAFTAGFESTRFP